MRPEDNTVASTELYIARAAARDDGGSAMQDAAIHRKSIHLEKHGSMTLLEMNGPVSRKFTLPENVMRRVLVPEYSQKGEGGAGLLQRVHLQRMSIGVGSANEFPFSIGIKVHGVPGMVFDETGQEWSFIFGPQTHLGHDVPVFESSGDEKLMKSWEEEFPRWNVDNLETVCAMAVPDSEIVMTHVDHPVVQLLEKKFDEFGTEAPSRTQVTTPNWFNVNATVFANACRWLRENILKKSTKTFDFSQLTVSFGKTDTSKFTDLAPSCFRDMPLAPGQSVAAVNDSKIAYGNILVQRCFGLTVRLVLEYRLAGVDS